MVDDVQTGGPWPGARPNAHAFARPGLEAPAALAVDSPASACPRRMRPGARTRCSPSAAPELALTAPLGGSSYGDVVGARDRGGDVEGRRTVLAHTLSFLFS